MNKRFLIYGVATVVTAIVIGSVIWFDSLKSKGTGIFSVAKGLVYLCRIGKIIAKDA